MKSFSPLILGLLLLVSLSPLSGARIGYSLSSEEALTLESNYLTQPPNSRKLIEAMALSDAYQASLESAESAHAALINPGKAESVKPEESEQKDRSAERITWVDLSANLDRSSSDLLKRHLMLKEKLDALVFINLKKNGNFLIGRLWVMYRGDASPEQTADQLISDVSQEGFTRWVLPHLYKTIYAEEVSLFSVDSFDHSIDVDIDGERVEHAQLYLIPPGEHLIRLSTGLRIPREELLTFKPYEWISIDGNLEERTAPPMLLKGSGTVSYSGNQNRALPFVLPSQSLPFTLSAQKEGYISERITITEPAEQREITLHRVEFNPAVTVRREQRSFYTSLARTMLLFATARVFSIVSEDEYPPLTHMIDSLALISTGDTVRSLFDYYVKSKYSVTTATY